MKVMIAGLRLNLNNKEQYILVWSPTSAGNFTMTSVWNIDRHKGIGTITFNKILHEDIPFKMSFVIQRAIISRLPIYAKISRLCIPLSPTWYCCTNNNIPTTLESAEHIFYSCEHGKKIWRLYAMPIGIEYTNINWKSLL